jgi:O-methyltransferase
MDNFFITRDFDWRIERASNVDRALNIVTRRFGIESKTARVVDDLIYRLTGHLPAPARSGISTNVEQRINLYHLVSQVIAYNVDGDLVEAGCNEGQSAVLIQKVIESHQSFKKLYLYDSFEGLPATGVEDGTSYRIGQLATSERQVRQNFQLHRLRLPVIHKGWFSDTLPGHLPETICFAHLDGDLYHSIMVSLTYIYPRLSRGAICLIDDYCDTDVNPRGWNHLPGVKKACDEFLSDKPEKITYLFSGAFSHGFFRKL